MDKLKKIFIVESNLVINVILSLQTITNTHKQIIFFSKKILSYNF